MKHWYLVETVYQHTAAPARPAFTRQWRVVHATGVADAASKAKAAAMAESAAQLQWSCVGIGSLIPLHNLADLCEITSQQFEPIDARAYCHNIARAEQRYFSNQHDLDLA